MTTYGYLVIDVGGYLCKNGLPALIAVWLNASKGTQDDIRLNISVSTES